MTIELTLGPRPDEPGPPIGGRESYPPRSSLAWPRTPEPSSPGIRSPARRCCRCCTWCSPKTVTLTKAGIAFCAGQLNLSDAEVAAVGTFYSMYRRTETGEYLVGVAPTRCARSWAVTPSWRHWRTTWVCTPGRPPATAASPSSTSSATRRATTRPVVMVNWEFLRQPNPSSAREPRQRPAGGRARHAHPWRRPVLLPRNGPDAGRCRTGHRRRQPDPERPPSRACGSPSALGEGPGGRNGDAPCLTPVLSRFWDEPEPWTLQTYLRHEGYQALRTALGMTPTRSSRR